MSTFQQDMSKYIEKLAEFSGDVFWIKNSDLTKQIYISSAYGEIWGRSCESLYADPRSWIDYVLPDDLERLHYAIEKCRKNPKKESSYAITYRIKRPDGQVLWIREKGRPIFDESDQLIGFGGIAQDISSLVKNQKVEQEIKILSAERDNYEEYLKSIVDSIAGNHWWKDQKGVYRGYNRTLLKNLGYQSPSDIIGKTDYELPWSDQAEHLVAHDREVMRRGVSIEREEVVTNNAGERRIYLVNKAPLRDSKGQIIGTIGHGVDITDLKQIQEELEKARHLLESKKDSIENHLVSIIHELVGNHWMKNLEGQYIACSNNLAKEIGLKSSDEMIGKTDYELPWSSQADTMVEFDKKVVKEKKCLTKEYSVVLPNGKMQYFMVIKAPLLDSNNNVIGVMGISINITEHRRLEKRLQQEKDQAESDRDKKAAALQEMSLELRTSLSSILGATEILAQKIDDSRLKTYVDDITNATNSLTKLINAHSDLSEKNLSKGPVITSACDSHKKKQDLVNVEGCRTLVVEDNVLNQKVTKALLEDLGCTVDIASCGKEALEKIDQNDYDIIFMDLGLPEIDGVTLTGRIRSNQESKDIAIVALTAHANEEDIQRCYDAEMNDVLTKPVSLDDLRNAILRYCCIKTPA